MCTGQGERPEDKFHVSHGQHESMGKLSGSLTSCLVLERERGSEDVRPGEDLDPRQELALNLYLTSKPLSSCSHYLYTWFTWTGYSEEQAVGHKTIPDLSMLAFWLPL